MSAKLAVPNKGRLYEPTINLLRDAGIGVIERGSRQLFADTNIPDLEVVFVRTNDIPNMVESGAADLGITGHDLVLENGCNVEEILDLGFGKARMVAAVHEKSSIDSVEDLDDDVKVATEFPNVTRDYFDEKGIEIVLTEVSGATEITPFIGVADVIVDITSTGTTLRTHGLEVIDTLFDTSVRLIANPQSLEDGEGKIEDVRMALESVIKAKPRKLVMLNAPEEKISKIKKLMPGMSGPTVSKVEGTDLLAVQAVVQSEEINEIVNKLKKEGARDILIIPIERVLL
ncbi:ATP phosphoribosyltransferase [candidate division MSBL1 archaeon SCGC-AAA382F02]|uniref:ATP phosphoribosyltransferase n=1 Tax=candidate division MSBL1 archaeon SCGC-AAA382F02 TaxID=1698282 RepID=A0A133VIK0_9EURY|nr:ATP phosphoribosyltransferase [candidate division MSBL1 archaeon SCGC-AAA382F02]